MPYSLTATLLDSLGVAMCVFDAQDHTLHWNDQFLRFFPEHADHVQVGEAYADNLRRFYRLRLPPEDHHHIERYVQDGLRRHRDQTQPYVFVHRGRKLRVAATPQANGDRVRVWIDLSLAEADVLTAIPSGLTGASAVPERLRVFEQLSDGISVHDADGRTVFANDRFMALYGLRSPTELAGQTYAALVHACWAQAESQADRAAAEDDLNAALSDSLHFVGVPFEVPLPGRRWVRVTMNAVSDQQTCGSHTDISLEKNHAAHMRALADQLRQETHRDALTGLINRRGLQPLLQELSAGTERYSLLFVDLDGFKAVNDSAGHAAGDRVLCQVATALTSAVRGQDRVIRIGGDEFVVVLRACEPAQAVVVAHKMVALIKSTEFEVPPHRFALGASVGVRSVLGAGDDPDVLLHDADTACYQAKRQGRGAVVVFGQA